MRASSLVGVCALPLAVPAACRVDVLGSRPGTGRLGVAARCGLEHLLPHAPPQYFGVCRGLGGDLSDWPASALIEAEVCCNGESRREDDRIRTLLRGWFSAPATAWTDVDRYLARQAVEVTNKYQGQGPGKKMGSADALHLAAALRLGCDFFMTHDTGYPHGQTVQGVQVLRPQVV